MASGIPYFTLPTLDLPGPIDIQPFGLLVASGVILGVWLMHRWAASHDLDQDHIRGLVNWILASGFIGAHVFDVLAYQSHRLAEDPLLLIKIWQGISSYGGFIGGVTGFFIYVLRHQLPIGRYADAGMAGFIPAFTIGRMGCTVVHDHIGAYTDDFFLATNYTQEVILKHGYGSPPGTLQPGLHHNLGFYELLYMLVLCVVVYGLARWRGRPAGLLPVVVAISYAPVRFLLEFLRVNPEADPRYVGLTFAQWMSIVMLGVGVYAAVRIFKAPAVPEARVVAAGAGKGGSEITPARGDYRGDARDDARGDARGDVRASEAGSGSGTGHGHGRGKTKSASEPRKRK